MHAQVVDDAAHAVGVLWVALVVEAVLGGHTGVGGAVDVVGMPLQRRYTAGDEHLAQRLRCLAQVVQCAKAAKALAQDTPGRIADQFAAYRFGVAHDGVRPEVAQVLGLRLGAQALQGLCRDGRRQAGAALVQQQHAIVLHGTPNPAAGRHGARSSKTGAALEVHQPRQCRIFLARRHHLARKHADGARGVVGRQGQVKLVAPNHQARHAVRGQQHRPRSLLDLSGDFLEECLGRGLALQEFFHQLGRSPLPAAFQD